MDTGSKNSIFIVIGKFLLTSAYSIILYQERLDKPSAYMLFKMSN